MIEQTPDSSVRVSELRDGRVLHVLIAAPKGNVITTAILTELSRVIEEYASNQRLRLLVIQGSGGNFSYGASVEEHRKESAPAMLSAFHAAIRALAVFPVPTAALVEGKCLGGGFEVALACTFLFATANARFGCPEIKLGVFPPVLAALGKQRLGAPLTDRLILTGATVDSSALASLSPAALTSTLGEHPLEEVLRFYDEHLASLSAAALRHALHAARIGSGLSEALGAALEALEQSYLRDVLSSHDGNEGIAAFIERRSPVWRDQ